jgi:hypothetical protein
MTSLATLIGLLPMAQAGPRERILCAARPGSHRWPDLVGATDDILVPAGFYLAYRNESPTIERGAPKQRQRIRPNAPRGEFFGGILKISLITGKIKFINHRIRELVFWNLRNSTSDSTTMPAPHGPQCFAHFVIYQQLNQEHPS